jgi:hypothetical protein
VKILLALLLFIPSLSWGNEKIIFCYLYETSFRADEADGIINQMTDENNF